MKRKLLTDVELRARWSQKRTSTYFVEEGTILTPAAMDFLRENKIELRRAPAVEEMTVVQVPIRDGKRVFEDAKTGSFTTEKPEEMTHLRRNLLVPKTHPRICLRGKLDSLMAKILELQLQADTAGETELRKDLGELLMYTREILAAEVKDEPLDAPNLLGMDSGEIRRTSHQIKQVYGIEHPIPDYQMGVLCLGLNSLRTQVRETELAAAQAFETETGFSRKDLIEGLNRLSSCVYILFCRKLAGFY